MSSDAQSLALNAQDCASPYRGTLSRLDLNGRLRIFSPAPEFQTPEALDNAYFDAWVKMLHEFVPGERVPSEWWESQLPIYIG
jgi:hypothetical protein